MGTILQRKIVSAKSGAQGELDVDTDWVTFDKKVLLNESHPLCLPRRSRFPQR